MHSGNTNLCAEEKTYKSTIFSTHTHTHPHTRTHTVTILYDLALLSIE